MGYILVILQAIIFATFPTIQGNVLAHGMTPIAMVIVMNGVCCLSAFVMCLLQHKSLKVDKRQLASLLLIGAFGLFITDWLLDVAYTLIPVGYVTMINFLYPSIICIVMATVFKEGVTWRKVMAVVLSIAGLALFAGGHFTGSLLGVVLAAITALAYSFYMIATDKTPASEVDPMVRVAYTNIVVTVLAIIVSFRMDCVFPTATIDWFWCIVVGILLCICIWLINVGIGMIGPYRAAFFSMIEPVGSMVISVLFFQYHVGVAAAVGCVLILAAMLFTIEKDPGRLDLAPAEDSSVA